MIFTGRTASWKTDDKFYDNLRKGTESSENSGKKCRFCQRIEFDGENVLLPRKQRNRLSNYFRFISIENSFFFGRKGLRELIKLTIKF